MPAIQLRMFLLLTGTASIKMREIVPSHGKEFYLLVGDTLNTKKAACSFRMFERLCFRQHRLFMFVIMPLVRSVVEC